MRGVSSPAVEPKTQTHNKMIIKALYKALECGNTQTLAKLLASDLEWWFHGPPNRQYMMRKLTGESKHVEFKFRPRRITGLNDGVIAEGWEGSKAYWVHVWTPNEKGLIHQFREYFNTSLTVLLRAWDGDEAENPTLWQTDSRVRLTHSLPDLVLAM
ncbi:Wound-induced protein Wun1-like [Dillenia turbinata]|uniref:Wound-induced protein Wun1-like n=1 Tax=Dillenia turbinata TaxID=194707 RepID=A0AAN8VBP1_9MAGN